VEIANGALTKSIYAIPMDSQTKPRPNAVEVFRSTSLCLVAFSATVATLLTVALQVQVDPKGVDVLAWIFASSLIASIALASRIRRVADCFGGLAHVWMGGTASCVIAVVGLRLQMPVSDQLLLFFDRAIGFDAPGMLIRTFNQPHWLVSLLSFTYHSTLAAVCFSIIALAFVGDRLELWRGAMCFTGTALTTCLISTMVPARGMITWLTPQLVQLLPPGSRNDFWASYGQFATFHEGADAVLRLNSLGPAVTFPSFHTIMGLVVVTMWRTRLATFVPACLWFVVLLPSTLPIGGHYFVDLLGGMAVWTLWFAWSLRLERNASRPIGGREHLTLLPAGGMAG
jgi:hypothetical protein